MRVMTIDIGTNSTLHLVAEVSNDKIEVLERGIDGNSLGADIASDGIINAHLLQKNRELLAALHKKSQDYACEKISAVGTHALRRCSNSREFISMAGSTGIPLRIIPDDEEAKLTWRGVFGREAPGEKTGLLDLGGGSSELILGSGSQPEWNDSVPVGAVMLGREHFKNDPPLEIEIYCAEREVLKAFDRWNLLSDQDFKLTAVAGTVTALAAIKHKIKEYNPGCLEGLLLSHDEVNEMRTRLLKLDIEQRISIPEMPPARAESIHAGVLILDIILKIINRKDLRVSENGVLFGLALEVTTE